MIKIENYNNDRKCNQKFCDKGYTHFVEVNFLGLLFQIPMCEKHSNDFADRYFKFEEGIKNAN